MYPKWVLVEMQIHDLQSQRIWFSRSGIWAQESTSLNQCPLRCRWSLCQSLFEDSDARHVWSWSTQTLSIQGHTSRTWWNQDSDPLSSTGLMSVLHVVESEVADYIEVWTRFRKPLKSPRSTASGVVCLLITKVKSPRISPPLNRHLKEVRLW